MIGGLPFTRRYAYHAACMNQILLALMQKGSKRFKRVDVGEPRTAALINEVLIEIERLGGKMINRVEEHAEFDPFLMTEIAREINKLKYVFK